MLTETQVAKLRKIAKMKECLNPDQKKKMCKLLTYFKKLAKEEYTGNIGGETDITNPDNLQVNEDEFTTDAEGEQNIVAKTFDTKADFDSYVNQRRGIEMTPREQQTVLNFTKVKPTQRDRFFVKYETTDDFGNNNTTVIKKLKEGNQFCWTAFSKHETAEEEGKPEGGEEEVHEQEDEVTVDDPIRITKTITFVDETEGSNILGNFLRKLEL